MTKHKDSTTATKNVVPFTKSVTTTSHDIELELETTIDSLCSLLCVSSSDEFTEYSPQIQIGFLYGCFQMAEKIKSDFDDLFRARAVESGKREVMA